MSDNRLPESNLSTPEKVEPRPDEVRRAALKRGAIALPILLATVYGRTTWAQQQGSGVASGGPSQQLQQGQQPELH
jgi:hypothetical protein